MESSFRSQILVDKLSKLNSSQQSIETLSHWCIFHMHKAKQVVETWEKQFHCAPRKQKLVFLYLANDIIQNSRRKGDDFVAEFWKVLPNSLRDVIENGDDYGRNAALRLINIWEERKVFGSRGQILKEEFLKRPLDNGNRQWNNAGVKSQGGDPLDKLVSGYHAVYGCKFDVDAIINKCRNSASFIEKAAQDIEHEYASGNINSGITSKLKEQQATLTECIEQLGVVKSSRANLVALLKEALQEQEYKLDQVRHHLQKAQKHSERANSICASLATREQNGSGSGSGSAIYTRPAPFAENSGSVEDPKSAAAAVAAKLAASTSSAQMLSFVLNSLASEGGSDYPWEKRAKLDDEHASFRHTDGLPPPPPSPPPPAPLPPPAYLVPQYFPSDVPQYHPSVGEGAPPSVSEMYQHYPASELGSYGQPSSLHGQ